MGLISLPDNTSKVSVAINKSLKVLYTNVDQFLTKRDLLLAQITGHSTPDIIIITEMLPKAPGAVVNSSLFALPGYTLYLNFDPDNYDPAISDICGVGNFVSRKLQSNQVFFNSSNFKGQSQTPRI